MFIGQNDIPSEGVTSRPKAIMSMTMLPVEKETIPRALLTVSVTEPVVNEIPGGVPVKEPVAIKDVITQQQVSNELHDIDILPAKEPEKQAAVTPAAVRTEVADIETETTEPKPFPWWILALGTAGAMYALS